MSEGNISALKSMVFAQHQLLQVLCDELDAEREASATSATEVLSVIIRLQEEKATVKMEADQYRRLSEEKMCHVQKMLAKIEDVLYHKEMEVAALELQVEAYRCRLLSTVCTDIESSWMMFLPYDLTLLDNANVHDVFEVQPGSRQFNGMPEHVEVVRTAELGNRDEEYKLLNEIKVQLDSLHDVIKSWKGKKSSATDDSFGSLVEVLALRIKFQLFRPPHAPEMCVRLNIYSDIFSKIHRQCCIFGFDPAETSGAVLLSSLANSDVNKRS